MAAIGTVTEIRDRLRRKLGYASASVLLPTDSLDDILDEALRTVNKYWPTYLVASFVTVADQQEYTGILPAGGQQIVEVFWSDCVCNAALRLAWPNTELADVGFEVDEQGRHYSPWPSTLAIVQRKNDALRRLYGKSRVIMDFGTVRLIPTPTLAGTSVYFVYAANRFDAVTDITDQVPQLVEAFWAAAMLAGNTLLALGAGAVQKVTEPDGTSITMAVSAHERAAARAEDRLHSLTPLAPSWWSAPAVCPP